MISVTAVGPADAKTVRVSIRKWERPIFKVGNSVRVRVGRQVRKGKVVELDGLIAVVEVADG